MKNCLYCNRQNIRIRSIAHCNPCNIDYYIDSEHANMRLQNAHSYTIPYFQFSLNHNNPWSKIILGAKILLKVNAIMNITPQNIKEKLKLYILFS